MGVAVPSEAKMRAIIGLPLQKALQQLGNLNDEDAVKATDLYRQLFPIYKVNYVKVFPSVIETLQALKDRGIRMTILLASCHQARCSSSVTITKKY